MDVSYGLFKLPVLDLQGLHLMMCPGFIQGLPGYRGGLLFLFKARFSFVCFSYRFLGCLETQPGLPSSFGHLLFGMRILTVVYGAHADRPVGI
jgi:hypothetical protein